MARLMNFRTLVAESLEAGDAMKFKEIFKEKLEDSYIRQQKTIVEGIHEQTDPEASMVTAIQSAGKSYGAKQFVYDQGVLSVTVPTGQSALDFANFLDENENVDSYEVYKVVEDGDEGATDLEKMVEGDESDYEFTVYLVTDNVRFEAYEIEEQMKSDEEESSEDESAEEDSTESSEDENAEEDSEDSGKCEKDMEEGKCGKKKKAVMETFEPMDYRDWLTEVAKVVTFQAGLKKIKMQCPPGQKWNPTTRKCEKMSAAENRKRHIDAIKAARKRAPRLAMIAKKRAKSMAKRISSGY